MTRQIGQVPNCSAPIHPVSLQGPLKPAVINTDVHTGVCITLQHAFKLTVSWENFSCEHESPISGDETPSNKQNTHSFQAQNSTNNFMLLDFLLYLLTCYSLNNFVISFPLPHCYYLLFCIFHFSFLALLFLLSCNSGPGSFSV